VISKTKIYLETTTVPVERTVGEINAYLVQAGAREILTEYENGKIKGIKFSLETRGATQIYKVPAKVEPVERILQRHDRRVGRQMQRMAQAERTAWRLVYRWVQAQLAFIQLGQVKADQVFLPYAQDETGKTFYEALMETGRLALPPAPETKIKQLPEAQR
jgi:hypothetical protein